MDDCKLCKFLHRYLNGEEERVVYESEHVLAVYSTKPFAEVHIMILTKKHIPSMFEMIESDILKDIWSAIQVASQEVFALKGACKLEMYTGKFPTFTALKHFHCHVIYDSTVD